MLRATHSNFVGTLYVVGDDLVTLVRAHNHSRSLLCGGDRPSAILSACIKCTRTRTMDHEHPCPALVIERRTVRLRHPCSTTVTTAHTEPLYVVTLELTTNLMTSETVKLSPSHLAPQPPLARSERPGLDKTATPSSMADDDDASPDLESLGLRQHWETQPITLTEESSLTAVLAFARVMVGLVCLFTLAPSPLRTISTLVVGGHILS